uniref:Alanine--tRNA ligase n=1 Tax=Ignisphaera aggregans TaxID=334771 RepID=A0A7J3Z6W1_9CREN
MSRPIDESIYAVKMFSERGYKRAKCRYCGTHFWSTISRENCGDAPCTDYTFFTISARKPLSYREVRNLFLDFFRKRGHEVVEPRPVVARWREDLYLTIASIVVFQPHVTSGIVEPPANPLVIAQPCIRLEDIDAVGFTLGRHLTNFIMGGHHAFNYPDKYIYWVNETVEFAKEFFVEELGISEEELVFKESWWEGGGNAGPSFEVAVGGLELATLVFMMYKVEGVNYVELPLKIVDTGYGIERIAWFTQKTPTAFHAVYGDLVREFHKMLGVSEPEKDVLYTLVKKAGRYDLADSDSFSKAVDLVAIELNTSSVELKELLKRVFDVYAVLDHTKSLTLMLADGIVPSNSGEGYLARLVIRRTLRRLSRLGADVRLAELIAKQVSFWGDMYPNMLKRRDIILEIIDLEEDKFKEVLSKVSTIATRYSKKAPSVEELIQLYDSHGIPPDVLSQELERRHGIKFDVPHNFYSLVASRHSRPRILKELGEEATLPKDVVEWASRLPETRRLFHEDPYMRVFKARVLGVHENYVVLDATAFYPEGGGQLGDRGYLKTSEMSYRVIDTKKVGNVVVHVVESATGLKGGVEVVGEIDWGFRYRRMRHHTATHILLGALRRVLGEHVWQAGAEKTEHKARLDVTHYKMPSREEIERIEALANSIIDAGLDVKVTYMHRNEAEKKYGFTLYQGGVPMTPVIRVVEIPQWDAEACFGTHVRNTREVGVLKIISVDKIADGVIRFEFIAGTATIDYVKQLESRLARIAHALGSSFEEVDRRVEGVSRELENMKNMLKSYREFYQSLLMEQISKYAEDLGKAKLYILKTGVQDEDVLKSVTLKAVNTMPRLVLIILQPKEQKTYFEISLGSEAQQYLDARDLAKELSKHIKIKAGGKRDHVTGVIERTEIDLENIVRNTIKELMESKSKQK